MFIELKEEIKAEGYLELKLASMMELFLKINSENFAVIR